MQIPKWIKDLTNKKLKEEYTSTYEAIHIVECFNTNDLQILELLTKELHERKIKINSTTKITFEDEK